MTSQQCALKANSGSIFGEMNWNWRPARAVVRVKPPKGGRHHVCTETNMASAADRDPRHHTQKMQKALQEIKDHLREDIEKVDEPQLKAMFETSAEVLGGLIKAFHDYEQKNESAWRKAS
jgi:hypothetical protein